MDVVDLYLRKSNYDGGNSAVRQETDLTAEVDEAGLTIGRTFVDPDLSASRFAKKARPNYEALVAHIHSGHCKVVGIVEASRGSRGLTEWSGFLDLCRTKKVKIWVQTHGRTYDLSRRRDWKTLAEDGLSAADESEVISERSLSGKRKSAAEGRPAGRINYGYGRRYDPPPAGSRWRKPIAVQIVDEDEKPVVVEMYKRVAAGGDGNTLYAIAADLTKRGIHKRTGKPWTPTAIRQLLVRPGYAGQRVHHGAVLGAAAWPALVDEKLWRKAHATLTRPGRQISRGTALAHWLSGVALCGACRADHLRPGSGGRYTCRGCKRLTVAGKPFLALVEAAVLGRLADPGFADAFRAAQPDTSALGEAEADLADLRATLAGHYAQARARRLSPGGLAAVEPGLLEDIAKAERRVSALSLPADLAEIGDPAEIIAEWATMSAVRRRIVVRAVVALVVMPAAVKGGRGLDPRRLDASRWAGDTMTWGQRRAS